MKLNLHEFDIVRTSSIIEAPSKKGTKFWKIHVLRKKNTDDFYTCSSSWHTLSHDTEAHSKIVWSVPYLAEPTNVGRANERNSEEQANFEFEAAVKKQLDKRKSNRPLPMLAEKYQEKHEYITYPCAVSPKLDGFRVLYNGTEAWTRGNKLIIPEVLSHIHFNTQGHIVDGELLLPGFRPVNESRSAGTRYQKGITDTLEYHIFDIVDVSTPYSKRIQWIADVVRESNNPFIKIVPVMMAHNKDEVMDFHNQWTAMGYEGTMVRNLESLYEINTRTTNLQKMKEFLEGDFEIVDVVPSGGGNAALMGKFICKDDKDELFESTAMGSEDLRMEYLANKQNYIGKFAKIKFVCLSGAKQIPFHSNVLEVRDREEF